MKLSDAMSAAELSAYAEVGLLIFLGVFIAVAIRVLWPGQSAHYERVGRIPLDDEPVEARIPGSKR